MKKHSFKKKILPLLLTMVMLFSSVPTVFAAGLPFTDVPAGAWYYNDVETAYNTGLINGTSATTYAPSKNITYAEVVKLAACIHQKSYEGAVTLTPGSPWYQTFVDYAKTNGIINKDYSWNENATRAGYMEIFAKALKDADLAAANTVPDNSIPDVSMSHPASKSIYQLYRAGILTGSDDAHSCKPDTMITRAEVAAILTRMMQKEKRLSFSMGEPDALTITAQPQDATVTTGNEARFSVAVSGGKAPYTYQWQSVYTSFDFPVLIEAGKRYTENGGATLVIKTETDITDGFQTYYCIITDSEGNKVTSRHAIITATGDTNVVKFIKHPNNFAFSPGQAASFTAEITGGKAPYYYLWVINGRTYGAFNCLDQNFRPVPDEENIISAWVQCSAHDAAGRYATTHSDTVLLSAKNPASSLAFTQQPQDAYTTEDGVVTFDVKVSGGRAPYEYIWHTIRGDGDDHQIISNSDVFNTNQSTGSFKCDLGGVSDPMTGKPETVKAVYCEVTDKNGYVTVSRMAEIHIGDTAPAPLKITSEPKDADVTAGTTVKFNVAVSGGTSPYTYKWYSVSDGFATPYNGKNIENGGATIVEKPQTDISYGSLMFYCVVTDSAGNSVTSRSAGLTVSGDTNFPYFVKQPEDQTIRLGATASFTADVAGGTAPYTYRWSLNGETDWSYNNQTFHPVLDRTVSSVVIQCDVIDAVGRSVTSEPAFLTLNSPLITFSSMPEVITQYSDGNVIVIPVNVSGGTAPYTYIWHTISNDEHLNDVANYRSDRDCKIDQETGTFTFYPNGKPSIPRYIYCEVTDANGNSAASHPILIDLNL